MNIGIIGYGYWGPNLVRNFSGIEDCNVTMVADERKERLAIAKRTYPFLNTTTSAEELIRSKEVDAVVIATPTFTHYPLAKSALMHDKHVLVEKPLASSMAHANELVELSQKRGKLLMVDHTFLYTGAVEKIKTLIDEKTIGNIQYFDSTRINLGLFQPDLNVLWDLAPHDISILTYLISEKPYSIYALGVCHTNNGIENIAFLTLTFRSGMIAHFNCSWSSPVKIRQILIGGDKKMILYNDIDVAEKVKVYSTGVEIKTDEEKQQMLIDYRVGDVFIPKLDTREALYKMAADFSRSISDKSEPVSNWKIGLEVVRILEASSQSIKNNGKEIVL